MSYVFVPKDFISIYCSCSSTRCVFQDPMWGWIRQETTTIISVQRYCCINKVESLYTYGFDMFDDIETGGSSFHFNLHVTRGYPWCGTTFYCSHSLTCVVLCQWESMTHSHLLLKSILPQRRLEPNLDLGFFVWWVKHMTQLFTPSCDHCNSCDHVKVLSTAVDIFKGGRGVS